jgi:REP element-mobilizing transposase RayT
MTAPRQVLPGTTYLVSRRCTQRQFLLRPSNEVNELFGFLLAVAAERYHVEVHAYCVMSNHVHLVVSDPGAQIPAFNQFLASLVARSMNALLVRFENFWATSSYSAVALQNPADIVDKVAYVLANPVSAGLVRHGKQWPGLWSSPGQIGADALEFKKPAWFFRKKGKTALPELARLKLVAPPGFGSQEEFRRVMEDTLTAREEDAAAKLAAEGRGFLGAQGVQAQTPLAQPSAAGPRFGLNPRIACRDQWRRVQVLRQLVTFIQDHRAALEKWRTGERAVVFPFGTYLMRVVHGVTCPAPG